MSNVDWEKYNAEKVTMKETDAEKEGDAENEKVRRRRRRQEDSS